MTPNHAFFIPIIFFLGVFVGVAVTSVSVSGGVASHVSRPPGRIKGATLGAVFGVFVLVFMVTHMAPIPWGAKALHASLGHQSLFDQQAAESVSEVYARLEAFGESGRAAYGRFTYTTDVMFPVSFLALLLVLGRFVRERTILPMMLRRAVLFIPVAWFLSDIIENAIIYALVSSFPSQHVVLAAILGPVTLLKFTLLTLAVVLPVIVYVVRRDWRTEWINGSQARPL